MIWLRNSYWRGLNWFKRHVSPAALAVLLCMLIAGPYLFFAPIHGYADNGDFWRAIYPNGIYPFKQTRSGYFSYIAPRYHIMQYYNANKMLVYSSQTLFIRFAVLLNQLFYSKTIFDIRFLGGLYFALFLGALYMLTVALTTPQRRLRSYLIAIMVVVVFGDTALMLYFNSFFAEPVGYIALLYAVAAWLLVSRKHYRRKWPLLLTYLLSVLIFITSKQQNAPIALSFMLVTAGLFLLPGARKRSGLIVAAIAVIGLSGVVTYALIPQSFNDINMYQTFTTGVLQENRAPGKAIDRSGIDRQYALMRDQQYNPPTYAPVLPSGKATSKHLTSKLSMAWVLQYYARHLHQFVELLNVATKNAMRVQPTMVGDYTRASGAKPLQQAHYFTASSLLFSTFYPRKFTFGIMMSIALIMVFSVGMYADIKTGTSEGQLRFFLILGLLSIIIFVPVVSIVGDGTADLAKHLFNVPIAVYLLLVIMIADSLNGRLWHAYREEAADS
ncbi:glycan biosynthesis hexose transferase WsfD [Lacticaseibacillus zhaodongensis]|uniref:glycan biosynthesis hexose transferase WsfD n=1 Tax=Lacticaseibacillus zhaodongensis TaxID=2668065 RepID=UPI0012D30A77|nr:hypothetical protein [Lacticaseibacillus zhaodongensis]